MGDPEFEAGRWRPAGGIKGCADVADMELRRPEGMSAAIWWDWLMVG